LGFLLIVGIQGLGVGFQLTFDPLAFGFQSFLGRDAGITGTGMEKLTVDADGFSAQQFQLLVQQDEISVRRTQCVPVHPAKLGDGAGSLVPAPQAARSAPSYAGIRAQLGINRPHQIDLANIVFDTWRQEGFLAVGYVLFVTSRYECHPIKFISTVRLRSPRSTANSFTVSPAWNAALAAPAARRR